MQDLLCTADVMERYQCERHKATNIMRKMPVLKVGNKLFIRMADLKRWEESQLVYPVILKRRRGV